MDSKRFESLLDGAQPSLADFAGFVSVIEKLPPELLWQALTKFQAMHSLLRGAMIKVVEERVARENIDQALDSITTRLMERLN